MTRIVQRLPRGQTPNNTFIKGTRVSFVAFLSSIARVAQGINPKGMTPNDMDIMLHFLAKQGEFSSANYGFVVYMVL